MRKRFAKAFIPPTASLAVVLLLTIYGISPVLAGVASDTNVSSPEGQGYFIQLIGGLVVVLLSILALAWLLKKLNRLPSKGQNILEIVATLSVGQRERLVIVRSGEVELLIGVAPGNIAKLHVLSSSVSGNSTTHSEPSDLLSLASDARGAGRR